MVRARTAPGFSAAQAQRQPLSSCQRHVARRGLVGTALPGRMGRGPSGSSPQVLVGRGRLKMEKEAEAGEKGEEKERTEIE